MPPSPGPPATKPTASARETGTNADKQRANTKDEDPTGLLNEGFHYRDIETGVWLSFLLPKAP